MGGSIGGEIKAEPNMTPLLDVVFQLITFFMLVFKISSSEFDSRVRLPVAGAATPVDAADADRDFFVLNLDSDGRLLWNGQALDIESAIKQIRDQAAVSRRNAERVQKKDLKEGEPLPTRVVFRADRRVPFATIYRFIAACQANGFTRFHLKAMNAEDS